VHATRCFRVARMSPTLNSRTFRRGFLLLPSLEMLTTSGLRWASLKGRNTAGEGTLLSPLWVVLPCRTRAGPTHTSQSLVNGQGNTVVSTAHGIITVLATGQDSSRGLAKRHPQCPSVTSHRCMMLTLTHPLVPRDQDSGENRLARVSTGPSRLV
jgi:hypothetical protein